MQAWSVRSVAKIFTTRSSPALRRKISIPKPCALARRSLFKYSKIGKAYKAPQRIVPFGTRLLATWTEAEEASPALVDHFPSSTHFISFSVAYLFSLY